MSLTSVRTVIRVLRLRIKDQHAPSSQATEVDCVWNYSNELAVRVFERERRFIGAFELQKFTDGATKAGLGLHSHTVQEVGQEYCRRGAEVRPRPGALQRAVAVPVGQLRRVPIRAEGRQFQRRRARALVPELICNLTCCFSQLQLP